MLSVILIAGTIGVLVYCFEPRITVLVEDSGKRHALRTCLEQAGISFEITNQGAFRAEGKSVTSLEKIWNEYMKLGVAPSLEFCTQQKFFSSSKLTF